jgi:NitT/TauT family transport system substrate-binding protein
MKRLLLGILISAFCSAETAEVRITRGAGGVGFLPLLVMEKNQLVEKHARTAGIPNLRVRWIGIGGPSGVNDALLSGAADFSAAGPPAFITLWDRSMNSVKVKGAAAITSLPMYLNVRAAHLKTLEDFTAKDKIAVTGVKVSIPSIIMQMYAAQKYGQAQATRFDKFTVQMAHPDAVIALLSGSGAVTAHFASPPYHQRERKDPQVRTIMKSDDVMGGSTTFTMLATTAKFHEQNPKVYGAVLKALEEAIQMIGADKQMAGGLLLSASGGLGTDKGFSLKDMVDMLGDPSTKFTTTPENTKKYADFMNSIGTIKNRPASWKDLFFPEIHGAPGS